MIITKNISRLKALIIVLIIGTSFQTPLNSHQESLVVAFAGLSKPGKTVLARELSKQSCIQCVLEAEEQDWPDVINKRNEYGTFTMWMGCREMWVPLQHQAQALDR
jgi:hypothetical protein